VAGGDRQEPVRALLDTNVLVRHLTGEPPGQAGRSTAFLKGRHELILPDLIVADLVYVLGSVYGRSREEVVAAVGSLLALPIVYVSDPALQLRALELYGSSKLDFPESYLVASAERTGVGRVVSFDRALDTVPTIARVEP
jgi:predicted nucleic-acid-binding protein